jgi:hypothetical protein
MIKKKNSISILAKMILKKIGRIRKKKYSIYSFRKIIVQDLGLVLILTLMKTDLDRKHLKKLIKSTNTEAEAGKINNHLDQMITKENMIRILIDTIEIDKVEDTHETVGIENIKIDEIVEIEEIIEIIRIIEVIMEAMVIEVEIVTMTRININQKNNKFHYRYQCQLKFRCQIKES